MTILTCFPEKEFEIISGLPGEADEQEQVEKFIDFVEESMQFCFMQSDIKDCGCSLRYLSIEEHPFLDLGDFYTVADINLDTLQDLADEQVIKIQLPVADGGVERINQVAEILGVPSDKPELAILAFFRIRMGHKLFEEKLDFSKTKAIIRGTKDSLEKLKKKGLYPANMGGVIDTPESVNNNDIWGLEETCPYGMPKFFIFSSPPEEDEREKPD